MLHLLGIDIGTTSFKAVAFDESGSVLASASVSPPNQDVTIDGCPVQVWPALALEDALDALIREITSRLPDGRVDALAIVDLGLVGLPIDQRGTPLYPAVAWLNPPDPRAGLEDCGIVDSELFAITGNRLSPVYPPAWIRWLTVHDSGYPRDPFKWVYTGDHLAYRLCGELAVDYSMASQTLVLDQRTLTYRTDFLEAMRLAPDLFPRPRQAGEVLGVVSSAAGERTGLKPGTPVVLGGADFVSGAMAAGMIDRGDTAVDSGTWECTVMCSDRPETSPELEASGAICDRHVAPDRWSIRIEYFSGDVTEWYRHELHGGAGGPAAWEQVVADAASIPPGSGGVVFVPHIMGSFGPVMDEHARGAFVGITRSTTRRHLARAVYEGLCYQSRHALEAIAAGIGRSPARIVVTSGGAKNPIWMQTRADVLGRPIDMATVPDGTPRGAAMIAGVGVGLFSDFHEAVRRFSPPTSRVEPDPAKSELYEQLYTDVYRPLCGALAPMNHRLKRLESGVAVRG